VCKQPAEGCTRQRGGRDSNPRPVDRKSGSPTTRPSSVRSQKFVGVGAVPLGVQSVPDHTKYASSPHAEFVGSRSNRMNRREGVSRNRSAGAPLHTSE